MNAPLMTLARALRPGALHTLLAASLLSAPALAQPVPLDAIKADLARGEVEAAFTRARELVKQSPDEREAWELQAAYANLVPRAAYPEIWQALKRLPAPPAPPESPAGPPPAPGEKWYVWATSLRLRAEGKPTAAILAEVPINTRVTVKAVRGDWALVEVSVPAAVTLGFIPGFTPPTERVTSQGHVPWRFLGKAAASKAGLLQEATALEKAGNVLEAGRRLERAVVLDPDDPELRLAAGRLAVASRQYEAALRVLLPVARENGAPSALAWEKRTPATLFYGCRGERAVMSAVDAVQGLKALAKAPANACIAGVDPVGPCSPPTPYAGAPFSEEDACANPEEYGDCHETRARYKKEHAAWERKAERFREQLRAIDALFPDSVHARFTLAGTDDAERRAKKLWAYHLPYRVSSCQDTFYEQKWERLRISTAGVELPRAGTVTAVWVELERPVDAVVGLVEAESAEAARAAVLAARGGGSSDAAATWAPRPNVVLTDTSCHCDATPAHEW